MKIYNKNGKVKRMRKEEGGKRKERKKEEKEELKRKTYGRREKKINE